MEHSKSVLEGIAMTVRIATAALVLAASPLIAQMSGVAHPDSTVITSDEAAPVTPRPLAAKPSAAVPATGSTEVYGPYVPYTGPKAATAPAMTHAMPTTPENPLDAMIVMSVPEREGELHEGTLLKAKMLAAISTDSTIRGARFTAEVTESIERNGRVIIPVGSIVEGQVTGVKSGRRISGGAALHLETRDVLLPDGTHYVVHAQVVEAGKNEFKITEEGTLRKRTIRRRRWPCWAA